MPVYSADVDVSVFANDVIRASERLSGYVSSYLSSDVSPYVNGGVIALEAAAIILFTKSDKVSKYVGKLNFIKKL